MNAMMDPPRHSCDGHLRVSDRERDETIDLLAQAATDGRLTLDEYSDRAGKALTARTRDDLAPLTGDLASPGAVTSARTPGAASPAEPRAERLVAIFGSQTRRGRWSVPARLESKAIFGECKIELQDATLHARVTVIDASAVFGSIEIVVPDGVDVQLTGRSIFGSRSCHVRAAPPGAPALEVRGVAMFGAVTVRRAGWREGVRKVVGARLDRWRP